MLFVRFKCPKCGEVFKKLGLMAKSDSTAMCPKCGEANVPLIEEDALYLKRIEDKRCSSYG